MSVKMLNGGFARRRPALYGALFYIVGTAAGLRWHGVVSATLLAALAVMALALAPPIRRGLRQFAAGIALLLLAWALAAHADGKRIEHQCRLLAEADGRGRVTLQGRIVTAYPVRPLRNGAHRYAFKMGNITLPDEKSPQNLPTLSLYIVWYGPDKASTNAIPMIGQTWQMRGRLVAPRRENSLYELRAGARESKQIRSPQLFDWRIRLELMRRSAAMRLSTGIEHHPVEVSLIHAILLGYRGEISPQLNRLFRYSGTIHIFAISGMHVMVAAGMLTLLIARLGVPRHLWLLPLAPLLALYICAIGAPPSAVRAAIMALLYLAAPLFGRRPDSSATLALAALLLLIANPLNLRDIGFILSFTMVAGLIVLAAPLIERLRRITNIERLRQDAMLHQELGGELAEKGFRARLRRFLLAAILYLCDLFAVSLAAWFTSAPLTAYYFKLFTPVSLLANLVVVPFAFVTMASAGLSLALYSISPWLAIVCNHLAFFSTAIMTAAARLTASWSWGVKTLPAPPPLWCVALWYLALALWGWYMRRTNRLTTSDSSWMDAV